MLAFLPMHSGLQNVLLRADNLDISTLAEPARAPCRYYKNVCSLKTLPDLPTRRMSKWALASLCGCPKSTASKTWLWVFWFLHLRCFRPSAPCICLSASYFRVVVSPPFLWERTCCRRQLHVWPQLQRGRVWQKGSSNFSLSLIFASTHLRLGWHQLQGN